MTASPNRVYLPAIDQLRALAALLVLFYHSFELIGAQLAYHQDFDMQKNWIYTRNPLVALIQEGHSGVTLFIVLSGFILSLGAIGHGINYFKFIWARVLRLYPLLIVCFLAAVLMRPLGSVSLYQSFITLIPLGVEGNLQSVFTTMFWAVTIEFQCYVFFPLANRFSNAFGTRAILGLIVASIAIRVGVFHLQSSGTARDLSYASLFGRFDQFLMGMLAARLYVEGKLDWVGRKNLVMSSLLVLVALTGFNQAGGLPVDGYWKLFWPTVEAAMWAAFIVAYFKTFKDAQNLASRILAKLGEISYSSYLWHFAVVVGVVRLGLFVQITHHPYIDAVITAILVVLPPTLLIALVSYQVVEKPFLGWRPKYISKIQP